MGALACLMSFGPCQLLACFYLSDHRPGAFDFRFFFLSTLSTGFYPLVDTPTFSFLSINFFVHSLGKIFRNPRALSLLAFLFPTSILTSHSHSFWQTASIRPLIIDIITNNCINKIPPPNLKRKRSFINTFGRDIFYNIHPTTQDYMY